jgi:hypothetical protein
MDAPYPVDRELTIVGPRCTRCKRPGCSFYAPALLASLARAAFVLHGVLCVIERNRDGRLPTLIEGPVSASGEKAAGSVQLQRSDCGTGVMRSSPGSVAPQLSSINADHSPVITPCRVEISSKTCRGNVSSLSLTALGRRIRSAGVLLGPGSVPLAICEPCRPPKRRNPACHPHSSANSRCNHALATVQSRLTVARLMPSASATSSFSSPPKKRSSTTLAALASTASKASKAS